MENQPTLFDRLQLGRVLEWSSTDKCILFASFTIAALTTNLLWAYDSLTREAAEPFINSEYIRGLIGWHWRLLAGWGLLVVLGRVIRRRSPESKLYAFCMTQYYAASYSYLGYGIGTLSIPVGIVLLGVSVFAFLIFDRIVVVAAVITGTAILGLTAVGSWRGWLPYAPVLRTFPFINGHLSGWWLLSVTLFFSPFLIFVLLLSGAILAHWRKRERRILELSTTDDLTQVLNRRTILHEFAREFERGLRHGRPLSFVMIDLDHFKNVNDLYGHLAGDEVLRETARRFKSCLRVPDRIGRYGGEEFCIVLPETTSEGAREVAERCRSAIAKEPITLEGGRSVSVTASLGHVSYPTPQVESVDDLIRLADEALYQAKDTGRDRVTAAGH